MALATEGMLEKLIGASLERDGYCVIEGVLSEDEVAAFRPVVERELAPRQGRGGVRNLLDFRATRALADNGAIAEIVEAVLGPGAMPVRGILFDKTSASNWKVPWHQDVTIAVAERLEVDGYGPWSLKEGVAHVQPPASVLQRMVTVRIHLDDCPEENGALKVVAGSHRRGKIPERQVAEIVADGEVRVCEAQAGGVLVMRPLLVHSSSAAEVPGHRRVIHFDFAGGDLNGGLKWAADKSCQC
jgi:ectoine hydroxylase-related dioxygenase (phytanoyl-CoA dioxygenase family)